MQLTQAACRRACARHLARSESAADCPPGRLFSAVRRQGPGAGCNSCTLPIRVVGEDGKSYPERRRISARSAFPESNPDGSGPEPASKPDVDPVPDPAVSAAADPEVRGSVASRCRAQRSTARPSPTRSSRPCGSQPSQRPLSKKDRIDFGALDRPQHAVRLDRRPRAGAARSRATDQAVARGGGQGRSRSGAARSRSVRAGLTRCACRRPVWRNGRSAVVMAQRSPPSPIPPSSAIPRRPQNQQASSFLLSYTRSPERRRCSDPTPMDVAAFSLRQHTPFLRSCVASSTVVSSSTEVVSGRVKMPPAAHIGCVTCPCRRWELVGVDGARGGLRVARLAPIRPAACDCEIASIDAIAAGRNGVRTTGGRRVVALVLRTNLHLGASNRAR